LPLLIRKKQADKSYSLQVAFPDLSLDQRACCGSSSAIGLLLSRRARLYTHLYLGIQSGIIVAVALMPHRDDWFSNLYIVLTLQAVLVLPSKIAFRWIGAFALMFITLLLYTRVLVVRADKDEASG